MKQVKEKQKNPFTEKQRSRLKETQPVTCKERQSNRTKTGRTVVLLTAAFLAAALVLTGCGSDKDKGDGTKTGDASKNLPRIGIIQMMEHPSLDTIRKSTLEELANEGYTDGDSCVIDYQNGQNDPGNMKSIVQKFKADNCSLIIAIATPAAQAAAGETTQIPIIFSAVTDPVQARLVKSLEEPGGNITGTSDAVSASKIMELADQITPNFHTIGALYNTSEDNSISVIADLKDYAAKKGLKVIESPITNQSEAQQAASVLADKADIVFSPIDNSIASSMPIVTQILDQAKVPFYVSADSMVADGGLATYGIDYQVLGKETGKMAAQVLKGSDPATMPVRTMNDMKVYVNTDTAEKVGIHIPQTVLDSAVRFPDTDQK